MNTEPFNSSLNPMIRRSYHESTVTTEAGHNETDWENFARLLTDAGWPCEVTAALVSRSALFTVKMGNITHHLDLFDNGDEGITISRRHSTIAVSDVKVGHMLDLEGDEFANSCLEDENMDYWEFEYGVVFDTEEETKTCTALTFQNGEVIGFPPDHEVCIAMATGTDGVMRWPAVWIEEVVTNVTCNERL